MATRDDVARRARVSPSTVSYVISGRRTISAPTRERVERAMRELNYTPNAFAQGLAGSRRGIVALHFPRSPQGLQITEFEYVAAATEQARRRGYHLLLWLGAIDDLDGLQSLISQGLVDGVLLMEVMSVDPRIPLLQSTGSPFVTIGRPEIPDGIICVDDDFDALGRLAIDHLADLGHSHVVFLTQPEESIERGHGPAVRTARALDVQARRRGVHLLRMHADTTVRGGHDAFARLVELDPRPTAVISFNEFATSGLLHAAAIAGLSIPGDLSLVGVSVAAAAAEMHTPPLTTVSPPSTTIAERAMDSLADLIEGTEIAVSETLVAPTLTIRGSTATPPRR